MKTPDSIVPGDASESGLAEAPCLHDGVVPDKRSADPEIPYPQREIRRRPSITGSRDNRTLGTWVPAFAGTTARMWPVASPHARMKTADYSASGRDFDGSGGGGLGGDGGWRQAPAVRPATIQ